VLRDLDGASGPDVYRLLTQVIVPRPIAWVLTDSGEDAGSGADRWNLGPYSYFMGLASAPPLVGFSVGIGRDGRVKDTLLNVRARPEHTILLPHRGQLDAVQRTSAELPPGTSEVADAGLEPVAWEWPTPRLAGARVALGCRLERCVELAPDDRQVLVVSRVHRVWLDDAVAVEDRPGSQLVDPVGLDPLARLGTGLYAGIDAPVRPAEDAGWQPR
jgi:flavin reductase (DIM6/NTAB) family NADH-FMN oxidoreductase RutF